MSMDESPTAGGPRFTVGGVISTALSVVFANVFRFLAIMLAVGLPVVALIVVGIAVMAAGTASDGPALTIESGNASQMLFMIFAVFLGLLAYFLIQSALTYGALQHLRGRPPAIGACISHGLSALPRVFLASLILFVVMGLFAFVVSALFGTLMAGPGAGGVIIALVFGAALLFVVTLLWVFVPAIVVERAGPLQCFRRSIALTRGHRSGIFGILCLIAAANWIISFISQALTKLAPVAGPVIDIASGLFFMALGSVVAAVGYYHLRAEKEGVLIDDIATVFD